MVVGMTELNNTSPADNLPDDISEAPSGRVSVAQDLYRHVNGAWLSSHHIPADRAVDGTFHQLRDQAEEDVRAIIEAAAQEEPHGRVGALYGSFMDETGIEQAGLSVLDADLDPIRDANSMEDLARALGQLDVTGVGGAVGYWVEKDSGSDVERAYLVQIGLGLPDEAYSARSSMRRRARLTWSLCRTCWSWRSRRHVRGGLQRRALRNPRRP